MTASNVGSWRDQILKEFTPGVARLTLVADPDGLLLEERVLEGIRERGFEMIPFDDRVAFRYAYESRFRSHWDRGEETELIVVLHCQASGLGSLPYDLLQAGRQLTFSLADVFPNLSYPVVAALDRGDLDALYEAQERYALGQLGDNATKEFVLRHVFGIAPELIKQPSDLLRVLLRRHYQGRLIPASLDQRLIQLLRQAGTFADWPLEKLVGDRESFFTFLQERWPVFLDRQVADKVPAVNEGKASYGLAIEGPTDLPFDHPDVRVLVDNLFIEGLLHPVSHEHAYSLARTWMGTGVRVAPAEDRPRRLGRLVDKLEDSLPTAGTRHGDWLHFSRGWAELILLANEQAEALPEQVRERIQRLQTKVDSEFTGWLLKRYAGLINLPPVPPVMLHHLPRFLARQMGDAHNIKLALVVIDGLAMDQWLVVRNAMSSRKRHFQFREQAVFAWVPSITSISRQATFAGRVPIFFPNSVHNNDKEAALWTQFWVDQGLAPGQIVYAKGLGDGSFDSISEMLSRPKVRVAGLVIDKVDKIMHGMELGTAGMHNQVRQWAQQPYLTMLIDLLLDRGFRIYLTSDHGNIEAEGCGRPTEGAVADLRGERVRIYPDEVLRSKVKGLFPTALEWQPIGLPDAYLPLIASGRQAFVHEGDRIVSHGGITIEEIIVPLVQIERRCP